MTTNKAKHIATVAIGVALYVVLSMTVKIPIVSHISLDLGYVVLGVYCYLLGPLAGIIVGACGCVIVSLIMNGWFPIGWMMGNMLIGLCCGCVYQTKVDWGRIDVIVDVIVTIGSMIVGILIVKTMIECAMFNLPVGPKMIRNGIAAIVDAAVMIFGRFLGERLEIQFPGGL